MGYHSYLVERFETTHENIFFRQLDETFHKSFSDQDGSHVLIGNLGVGGHSLDAIFIKRGAIIVIDFKDYSGTLSFSENGPWQITDDKQNFVFVAGGAVSRNPFQQVRAYRFSLYPFLSENEQKILDANHNVNWDHTSALILFHRDIKFDNGEIPAKVQRYFHITDYKRVVQLINDTHSKSLELTDTEIDKILGVLNVGEDLLYSKISPESDNEDRMIGSIDPARMDRIRQLIPDVTGEDELIKAVAYYYTMIAIERINDSTVSEVNSFPIDWQQVNKDEHHLNIEAHPRFHALIRRNLEERFPKNLFISVDVLMDGATVPLLYTIVHASDIRELDDIKLNFNSFILFRQVLTELELTEDIIEELSAKVNEADGLNKKIEAARKYLDVSIELTESVSLGLSSESIFTAQLQSELKQIIKGKVNVEGDLFKSFVTGEVIDFKISGPECNLIQITQLNLSQKQAIDLSFTQPLTVVTGPPGTGKSQVVTNILANGIIAGKKILFASKNNQAVDNVYERINELLETDYFVRLGSNDHIEDFRTTLQILLQKKDTDSFPDLSAEHLDQKNKLDSTLSELSDLQSKLKRIPLLKNAIRDTEFSIENKTHAFEEWLTSMNDAYRLMFIDNNNLIEVKNSELNAIENKLTKAQNGFFAKLLFNVFKKRTILNKVKSVNEQLPHDVQEYVEASKPYIRTDIPEVLAQIENVSLIKDLSQIRKDTVKKYEQDNNEINVLNDKLSKLDEDLKQLTTNELKIKERIKSLTEGLKHEGVALLKLAINESLRKSDTRFIAEYKSYLTNGLPWMNDEKIEFMRVLEAFLNIFYSISITNLTVKKAFLLEPAIFDLVVIDEASQCDIASAIPLLYRAKSAVVIGDPLQLPHITSVKQHEQEFVLERLGLDKSRYNYVKNSLFNHAQLLSNRSNLSSTFLDEHYRCHPDIISFSNRYFYERKAGQQLNIMTDKSSFSFGDPGLHWVNVVGQPQERNLNTAEVSMCVNLAKKLSKKYPQASIGVVTPFKHQKEAIKSALSHELTNENVVCDTVHRFQGDEKDIIILSLVVTNECTGSLPNFINIYSPYLLNVAITRARSALYIVGNKEYCKALRNDKGKTLLCNLALYSEQVIN